MKAAETMNATDGKTATQAATRLFQTTPWRGGTAEPKIEGISWRLRKSSLSLRNRLAGNKQFSYRERLPSDQVDVEATDRLSDYTAQVVKNKHRKCDATTAEVEEILATVRGGNSVVETGEVGMALGAAPGLPLGLENETKTVREGEPGGDAMPCIASR